MSMTIAEIKGDACGRVDKTEPLEVDLVSCSQGCIRVHQADDYLELTPRMISDLIDALTKHQEKGNG